MDVVAALRDPELTGLSTARAIFLSGATQTADAGGQAVNRHPGDRLPRPEGAGDRKSLINSFSGQRPALSGMTVATLGPEGTDAQAEACLLGCKTILVESFPLAMAWAERAQALALVAAGYLDVKSPSTDSSWVDLHYSFRDRLRLASLWESPTKPMCVAVRRDQGHDLNTVRSVALHRSTRALAGPLFSGLTQLTFVRAKPLAVQLLVAGEVDACVGSVDVVARHPGLKVLTLFEPTMVWCLYQPVEVIVPICHQMVTPRVRVH